jgi:hypothetical protein
MEAGSPTSSCSTVLSAVNVGGDRGLRLTCASKIFRTPWRQPWESFLTETPSTSRFNSSPDTSCASSSESSTSAALRAEPFLKTSPSSNVRVRLCDPRGDLGDDGRGRLSSAGIDSGVKSGFDDVDDSPPPFGVVGERGPAPSLSESVSSSESVMLNDGEVAVS